MMRRIRRSVATSAFSMRSATIRSGGVRGCVRASPHFYNSEDEVDALLAAPEPHVVLTSSVAGRVVPANRNHMYAASKFAVEALGDGLRKEMTGRVRVTLIEPGAVDTDFADWGGTVLSAGDVARAVVYALDQPAGVAVNQIMLRPLTQEM